MGIASTVKAVGVLAKVKVSETSQEFKVAKAITEQDAFLRNIDSIVERKRREIARISDRLEELDKETVEETAKLREAQRELGDMESLQAIRNAQVEAETPPHVVPVP